jgi:DNA-binding PadR family transcriptional regulator
MNVAKFLVLGTLDQMVSASGYEIIRELDKKMVTHWTNVKKGSIYHALKALTKDEHIQETEKLKQGAFPTMTLYKINKTGQNLFDTMQKEAFLGLYPYFFGFKLALKFNSRLEANQIQKYADKAIKIIDINIARRDEYIASLPKSDPNLDSYSFFIEHDKMLFIQEKKWIQMVIERLHE